MTDRATANETQHQMARGLEDNVERVERRLSEIME
jgi:hypothetical protein